MPECQRCGSHVSARYAAGMGDNNDVVHRCPRCPDVTQGDRYRGGVAGHDNSEVDA